MTTPRSPRLRTLVLSGALLATLVASVWPGDEHVPTPDIVAAIPRANAVPEDKRVMSDLPSLDDGLQRPFTNVEPDDLFSSKDWRPPPPKQKPSASPQAAPMPPPFPYAVAGSISDGDGWLIVFARDDRTFSLRPGEVLENTYRIDTIDATSVTVTFLPLGRSQVVRTAAAD